MTCVSGLKSSRRCAKYDNVDAVQVSISLVDSYISHYALGDSTISNSDYKISIQPDYVLIERPLGYEVVLSEQEIGRAHV